METSKDKLRVLIVSENTSDLFGGEAILPLHYFRYLRNRGIEVWLITHERVKERLLAIIPDEIERVIFIPDTLFHIYFHKISKMLPSRISTISTSIIMHMVTQFYQYKLANKAITQYQINIVHEPAPVSPKQPSIMFGLGVPVVIGPLNGGMNFPKAFTYMQSKYERIFYYFVRLLSHFINILIPGKLFADTILVANKRTRDALPFFITGKIIEFAENGVDLRLWNPSRKSFAKNEVRLIYLGRLVDWKCVDYLIRAIASVKTDQNIILDIVGDGDKRLDLESLANQLDCNNRVNFHGWVAQKHCPELLANADIFVLPSVRECGGAVMLEAMAMGLPVIAVNWGGASDYVTEKTGILIEPNNLTDFTHQLVSAIEKLVSNPGLRSTMGKAGRKRIIDQFDWDKKIDFILNIYTDLVK